MSDKLPDKIIPISFLRKNHDKNKKCTCVNRKFEIDTQNKEVCCVECGTIVNPYDALLDISEHYEQINREVQRLLDQRKEILNWQPHLLAVRDLERIYRSKDMIPCCPHCGRGIEAKEFTTRMVNRKYEQERRRFENKEDKP